MFKSFRVDYYSGNRRFPEPLLLSQGNLILENFVFQLYRSIIPNKPTNSLIHFRNAVLKTDFLVELLRALNP